MKKKPEIIILVGNIGSSKTTLARKYAKEGYVIIARDDLRYNIGAGRYIFDRKLEKAIWQTEIDMVHNFLILGVNILIDGANVNEMLRSRYIRMVRACFPKYKRVAIELPRLDMKQSVDRRMKNQHGKFTRKIWEDVWKKFDNMYEKPIKKEGFHKIVRLNG